MVKPDRGPNLVSKFRYIVRGSEFQRVLHICR